MRRVVITSLGAITPLGVGADYSWQQLIKGVSGITKVTDQYDTSIIPSKIAGIIQRGESSDHKFNPDDFGITKNDMARSDKFIPYAIAASKEAVEKVGLHSLSDYERENIGVHIGSGIGGIDRIYQGSRKLYDGQYRQMSPFFIPGVLVNLPAGHVAIKYGFMGPNLSMATACSTGSHSIGDAYLMIKNSIADVMLAGGTESGVCPLGAAGFARMNALSTNFNDTPEKASRPWDKDRDGFVLSEGSGVLVLEELESAKKRGAPILCEVTGYGMSCDASHITAPSGRGAELCMMRALKSAGLNPSDIDYINAHGTSTSIGDLSEINSIKNVFKQDVANIAISSTKSSTGHLLGAAGSLEAIFCVKAIQNSIIPPTLNLDNPSEGCDLDLVPHTAKSKNINYALSNSFGFGGTNIALIFKKFVD